MTKIGIFGTALSAVLLLSSSAHAAQGLFGGRDPQDGSINFRSSTTEQFDPVRGQSVVARPRPDFDPTPIDVGSFQLFPQLNFGPYFDDNIYAASSGEQSDVVWQVSPVVSLLSNWGRHQLSFVGLANIDTYTDKSDENAYTIALKTEGRYDFAQKTSLGGNIEYQRISEARSSPNTPTDTDGPAHYDLYKTGAVLSREAGLLTAKATYDFSYFDYAHVKLVNGTTLNQNDRKRTDNAVGLEFAYQASENFKPFLRTAYDWSSYMDSSLRSSTGQRADVGAKMDFGGIITAEAYAGYMTRNYENFQGGKETGLVDFGGSFLWNVTEMTSIEGELGRTIEETTLDATPNYTTTGGSMTLTHELMRNVLLEADASYSYMDFRGAARKDNVYTAGVGGRYLINRNLYSDLNYTYTLRDSNQANGGYHRNVVLMRVGVQY